MTFAKVKKILAETNGPTASWVMLNGKGGGSSGHGTTVAKVNTVRTTGGDKKDMKKSSLPCYYCEGTAGESGHWKRDCPLLKSDRANKIRGKLFVSIYFL